MIKSSILHIPLSEYAYGLDEDTIVIRLRCAHGDATKCTLFFGDRSCRETPVIFTEAYMELVQETETYDYYEAKLLHPYKRMCYYFKIESADDWTYYYGDCFEKNLVDDRSEYFQLPFNHRADIVRVPDWVKDAVVYNIFPDSFAGGEKYISNTETEKEWNEWTVKGKRGGTIRGIIENIDYIKNLGFNTIYMNPIFTAGEYHKYDLLNYYEIDPVFGTNGDFAELVDKCHANNMRVIIDGVFNHCGWKFFAFDDVVKRGQDSPYKDWFYGLKYPVIRPEDPEEIPTYDCFGYERMMPKLDLDNPETIDYFCRVGRFWAEKYHIDGWRLDVASEINDGFWRAFRKEVKSVNPDILIIGEVWESANHWLNGDMFDSAMNYDLRKHCVRFFGNRSIDAVGFHQRMVNMLYRYREQTVYAQLNLLDSHDVSRFLSVCGEDTDLYKTAVVLQMMMPGIPSVFYGDEKGISGVLEDEYRSPMPWDRESSLQDFFKEIIEIRKSSDAIKSGRYRLLSAEPGSMFYAFERYIDNPSRESVSVFINLGEPEQTLDIGHREIKSCNGYMNGKLQKNGYVIAI